MVSCGKLIPKYFQSPQLRHKATKSKLIGYHKLQPQQLLIRTELAQVLDNLFALVYIELVLCLLCLVVFLQHVQLGVYILFVLVQFFHHLLQYPVLPLLDLLLLLLDQFMHINE